MVGFNTSADALTRPWPIERPQPRYTALPPALRPWRIARHNKKPGALSALGFLDHTIKPWNHLMVECL